MRQTKGVGRRNVAVARGRIGTEGAMQAIQGRAEVEDDARVREEIAAALGDPSFPPGARRA